MTTRSILTLAALGLAASSALAGYRDGVLALGPVGYWNFSSGPNSVVNGYTGTLVNGATIGDASTGPALPGEAIANPALVLDGTNQYVSTNLTGHFASSGTIVAWFYLPGTSVPQDTRTIAGTSTVGDDFDLQMFQGKIHFFTDGGSNTETRALTTADLNRWHFVAATFTAGVARTVYLDNDAPVTTVPGGHSPTTNAFWIGESAVFRGRYFPGRIDEVAVYDRALSDSEVALLRDGGVCAGDFNHDGDVGTDADIEAFFACLAGNCCPTCGTADFNGDGDTGTDADIEAFFRVLAGGGC